ncbi:hypothetical protein cypCar_00045075 [Cyprinus carpio]|nr:hypothetical protein cypCar_00045075 [Cyprinus carpio]
MASCSTVETGCPLRLKCGTGESILGKTPEFEEGASYVVKNHTLSSKYGKLSIFVKSASSKFKTAPLSLTEDQERRAKEILVPHSPLVSVDKVDPSEEGYVSLLGEIEELQKVWMAQVQFGKVPDLDFK